MSFLQVLIEAIIVGLGLIIVQLPITYIAMSYDKKENPPSTVYLSVSAVSFLSGFLFHIICEITGLNQYYVNYKTKY